MAAATPATGAPAGVGGRKTLTLAAMIFAAAMTFIDRTIVSIAVPKIQSELHLSINEVQWVVNAYLLALAAAFTFGGRLADMIGHRRMVIIGIVTFAAASTACGLTRPARRPRPGSSRGASYRASAARSCTRRRWPSWCRPSRSASAAAPWPSSSAWPAA
jgi:MFS family permease